MPQGGIHSSMRLYIDAIHLHEKYHFQSFSYVLINSHFPECCGVIRMKLNLIQISIYLKIKNKYILTSQKLLALNKTIFQELAGRRNLSTESVNYPTTQVGVNVEH